MSFSLSRLISTGTATYAVYACAQPRHLGRAVTRNGRGQARYDVLAYTYGARDLVISALAILGRSDRTVTAAMLARIAFDVSDGLILSAQAEDDDAKRLLVGVTFGWAALNSLALVTDRGRSRRR